MANLTQNPFTCALLNSVPLYTVDFRLGAFWTTCTMTAILLLSAIGWVCYRDNIHISSRSPGLSLLSGCGCLLFLLSFEALFITNGGSINCMLTIMLKHTGLPFIAWPYMVRIVLWGNKIRFNYFLATEIAKNGLEEVLTTDKRFQRMRFPASAKFGALLATLPMFFYLLAIFVYAVVDPCT